MNVGFDRMTVAHYMPAHVRRQWPQTPRPKETARTEDIWTGLHLALTWALAGAFHSYLANT